MASAKKNSPIITHTRFSHSKKGSSGSSSSSATEYTVRFPKTQARSTISWLSMQETESAVQQDAGSYGKRHECSAIYGEEETQEGAAGSEFGKKQREEARRKKFGIVTREFKVEDHPGFSRSMARQARGSEV
ncbi:hypothetical protein INR49_011214 [Caranx melampygus]|nr:hypothetical protein INR49_011214 [Caranx melampygus]